MVEKKNVLFIMTDAQRVDHLGCYGNTMVKTPNLDRLSSEGIRFTNYFCTNPICMPNRATLATGVYPNVHGVRSNGINLAENVPTIADTLRKRGWHTAALGKIHHQYWLGAYKHRYRSYEGLDDWANKDVTSNTFPSPYYGYDEVEVISGNGTVCSGHYLEWLEEKSPKIAEEMRTRVKNYDNLFSLFCEPIPEELYNTTYVVERNLAFLERYNNGNYGEKPFYLHCSFPDPHYPIFPPMKYQKMYKPEDIKLPSSFNDIKNLYNNHPFLGEHLRNPPFKKAFIRESTEDEVRKITALTYAAISYVDTCVGQLLASLEKNGLAKNTIVIFSSDHGDLMGDHGLLFKGPCPYNGVLQLPLIWKVPGLTKPSISHSLISSIDIPKTILNLLGIKERYHPDMQGYDITPILQDSNKIVRECCFIENDEEVGPLISRLRHLVTSEYKLTIYEEEPKFGDIFNRKNDPDELTNLWIDKNFKEIRFELVNRLLHENLKAQTRLPKRIAGT